MENEFVIENVTKRIVESSLNKVWDSLDMCHCRKCYMDVCAITLNGLKPKYVTSLRGAAFGRADEIDANYMADIGVQIGRAIERVSYSPMHIEDK